ncbi:hypothetical protein MITSMUL_04142 [Mitsuokella multacida DSM 20544]|uniref:Uncharacterized protein n=1 Tax=Mitsuokella multacida DSM 20544 TaxID=500635 RepID=C9KLQ8_9FIRM|nr:hypothetical protein MITSMUL_04142 [Mitsuokella multacida DSM 20544]
MIDLISTIWYYHKPFLSVHQEGFFACVGMECLRIGAMSLK